MGENRTRPSRRCSGPCPPSRSASWFAPASPRNCWTTSTIWYMPVAPTGCPRAFKPPCVADGQLARPAECCALQPQPRPLPALGEPARLQRQRAMMLKASCSSKKSISAGLDARPGHRPCAPNGRRPRATADPCGRARPGVGRRGRTPPRSRAPRNPAHVLGRDQHRGRRAVADGRGIQQVDRIAHHAGAGVIASRVIGSCSRALGLRAPLACALIEKGAKSVCFQPILVQVAPHDQRVEPDERNPRARSRNRRRRRWPARRWSPRPRSRSSSPRRPPERASTIAGRHGEERRPEGRRARGAGGLHFEGLCRRCPSQSATSAPRFSCAAELARKACCPR